GGGGTGGRPPTAGTSRAMSMTRGTGLPETADWPHSRPKDHERARAVRFGRAARASSERLPSLPWPSGTCCPNGWFERAARHLPRNLRVTTRVDPRTTAACESADEVFSSHMGWFLTLMDALEITCCVGDPAAIRKAETRRQKHDRRDAHLLLQLLTEHRFPSIWMPSTELRD